MCPGSKEMENNLQLFNASTTQYYRQLTPILVYARRSTLPEAFRGDTELLAQKVEIVMQLQGLMLRSFCRFIPREVFSAWLQIAN